MPPYNRGMNNNESHLAPRLDSFLAEMIEHLDPAVIASMNPKTALAILDITPEGAFRDALRDAMRDNIDTDIKFF